MAKRKVSRKYKQKTMMERQLQEKMCIRDRPYVMRVEKKNWEQSE